MHTATIQANEPFLTEALATIQALAAKCGETILINDSKSAKERELEALRADYAQRLEDYKNGIYEPFDEGWDEI